MLGWPWGKTRHRCMFHETYSLHLAYDTVLARLVSIVVRFLSFIVAWTWSVLYITLFAISEASLTSVDECPGWTLLFVSGLSKNKK